MSACHHFRLLARAAGAVVTVLVALSCCAGPASAAIPEWSTYRHDAARSGIDPEGGSPLAPARVWQSAALDGRIYAEPLLYGARVYVATENDTIYSLDAASGKIVWELHLGTPVPSTELPCGNIEPVLGITSTPVIDPATNTIYAVTDSWDGSHRESIRHRLVALDLTSGAMRAGFPIEADPPYPVGGSARQQLQRVALALDGNQIVVGYGGNNGDCGTYWGWLMAAPKDGVGALSHFQVEAAAGHHGGAIWGAGNGPAVDSAGRIYAATGNGYSGGTFGYSESVVKLEPSLALLEYWAPEEWLALDNEDRDLGSSDPLLLPDGLIFQIGKQGVGVLLHANALGGITKAVAELNVCGGGGSWGGGIYLPATVNTGTLYVTCNGGLRAVSLRALNAAKPEMSLAPGWNVNASVVGPPIFAGGLVWVASYTTGTLYGLDPPSGKVKFQENLGTFMHFATPSAGGGRLFAANNTQVTAFGIATLAHWYSNAHLVGSEPLPTIAWGALTNVANSAAGGGQITCRTVAGGYVSNPEGNGAGEGATQEFAAYECAGNIPCGSGHEQAVAVPASLPWPLKLEEKEGIRVNSTGVEVEIGCVQPPEFNKVTGAMFVTSPTALQNPLAPAGSNKGTGAAAPGITEFDEKGGELEVKGSKGVAKARTSGKLKTLGYEEQELVQVKSP